MVVVGGYVTSASVPPEAVATDDSPNREGRSFVALLASILAADRSADRGAATSFTSPTSLENVSSYDARSV